VNLERHLSNVQQHYGLPCVVDQGSRQPLPDFPVCMAKTQMSFSTDPTLRGAPSGHTVEISEVRVSAGAGFIVAIAGNMMTMPGLPKSPAAERIDVTDEGKIVGLF
jgi:formate--tetrahydrofolate ligase